MNSLFRVCVVGGLAFGASFLDGSAQTIRLNAGAIDPGRAVNPARARAAAMEFSGSQLHLVQFDGPIQPEWVEQLKQGGYQIVDYIPENAYLVYGNSAALKSTRARAKHVRWEGAYLASDKIHPRARPAAAASRKTMSGEDDRFAVQLVLDEAANAETVALLTSLAREPLKRDNEFRHYRNIVVRMDPAEVETIAARPDVISIAPYSMPKKLDERQDVIVAGQLTGNEPTAPGYLAWLASKGFTQQQFTSSGLVVDVADSGLDNGTTSPNHFGLYPGGNVGLASRVAYARLEGTPNTDSTLQGCDGHGTLNAHIVGGYNDSIGGFPQQDVSGFRYGLGVAPFVKLGSSVIFDPDTFTSPDFEDMISRAYRDGARISSESWGSRYSSGMYDIDAQQYDALVRDAQPADSAVPVAGNQGMTIVFAAGNDGPDMGTISPPGTAKNVIAVGAAENVQAFGGADSSGVDDDGADSANDIADFSSRGPCNDGRQKPEIVAPGTHVSGGVAQQILTAAGTGTPLACFNGEGVSGGPNDSIYFPTNQSFYTASSGTSHSTPAVAGGAALVYQYFLNQGWGAPSPAMIKAYLMNAARYMTGVDAHDTLWSKNQGMGMMNLGFAFDGVARVLRDQIPADKFTASGQTRAISGVPVDTNKPVRVSLSWTDAPGSTSGNSYNNDLNLIVTTGGKTYLGNVFKGAFSTNGGAADAKNNSESVFLPAGTTGKVGVVVTAANVNSDGVPNEEPALDQDYALVIYNVSEVPMPLVVGAGGTLVSEGCGVTGNGAIDPDETVTVNLALWNSGSANTTNVVATLLATGGVAGPSSPRSYGALLAGGAAVTQAFTFAATGECGGTLTATLSLNDNGLNLGTAAFTFRLGATANAVHSKTNFAAIALVDNAAASPYPSAIAISNVVGTIGKVTATLRGFSHEWPLGVDVVLVSPGGQAVSLMSGDGGYTETSAATLTFDDEAASALGDPIVSGTYLPSGTPGAMDSPAPPPPYGSALADFNGGDPNGTWELYARNTEDYFSGSIEQGWSISVTVAEPLCCGSNKPPIFGALTDKHIVESNRLSFTVTATDPNDGDPVALTASNLPAGATFPATNGQATFIWNNPAPTGTYSASFYATDKDGTTEKTIGIAVLPTSLASLEISPAIARFSSAASTGRVFGVAANVSWTATSNASWIAIASGSPGSGEGTVTYGVATNNGSLRTGTITISGGGIARTFTVKQAENEIEAELPLGEGTEANPYLINRLAHLIWMGDTVGDSYEKHYVLQSNIDATATAGWNDWAGFAPIGGAGTYMRFSGIFNGNGKAIGNLGIDRPTQDQVGFFGEIDDTAHVKDLGLPGCAVSGSNEVGCLVGWNHGAVSGCYATGSATGIGEYLGGLVGWNDGPVDGCHAAVSLAGISKVGGLVGLIYKDGTASNSYATGSVMGTGNSVGGLVGDINSNRTVSGCFATGDVVGKDYVGGLVGWNDGSVSACYASGAATGYDIVGGLVGNHDDNGIANDCHATGAVAGENYVGGLVGWIDGAVNRCYAAGLVTGDGFSAGGLVGINYDTGTVDNSYWDTQTTGQETSDGGTGKTTAQMMQQATFAGWDFASIWRIEENATYPYLAFQDAGPLLRPEVLVDANFGVLSNRFGFHINWTSGQVVVVDASTNLTQTNWMPVATGTLAGVPYYFSDPRWTNCIGRYYRIRLP